MRHFPACLLFLMGLAPGLSRAETPTYPIKIDAHVFAPAEVKVPTGVRVKLVVTNTHSLPSEFESAELNCEKVVPGDSTVSVWIGPLDPGKYKFFDDFNPGTTGWIVVPASGSGQ
jgi:plastocyanin